MKTERGGWRMIRRDELRDELVHDTYKSGKKLAEPSRCPECGAVYHRGRWTWGAAPAGAAAATCPACHRIKDQFPAGHVTLKGEFFASPPRRDPAARPAPGDEGAGGASAPAHHRDRAGSGRRADHDDRHPSRAQHRRRAALGLQRRAGLPLQQGGESPPRRVAALSQPPPASSARSAARPACVTLPAAMFRPAASPGSARSASVTPRPASAST